MSDIQTRMHAELDKRGWRPPWHEHWRIVQPPSGPPIAENCGASKCEAPGCPRTASGFPGAEALGGFGAGGKTET